MSRILFAWELGANYGYLARGLPVAEKLRAAGHRVIFVVRDTWVAAELLAPSRNNPERATHAAEAILAACNVRCEKISDLAASLLN